jgi:Ca-activated chloride channel family protein
MNAMAEAGAGNYYFVESPVQLRDLFATELSGLMALFGKGATLTVEPAPGVAVAEVLNEFARDGQGRLTLPELVAGMPLTVVVRLAVPARAEPGPLCQVRLEWDDPQAEGTRLWRSGSVALREGRSRAEWDAEPVLTEVAQQVALLMATRAQLEAAEALRRGDVTGAGVVYSVAMSGLQAVPGSPEIAEELEKLMEMKDMAVYDRILTAKMSHFEGTARRKGLHEKLKRAMDSLKKPEGGGPPAGS